MDDWTMGSAAESGRGRPLGAHMSIAGGISRAVERAVSAGADALQVFTKNQLQWRAPELTEEEAGHFRRAVEKAGLRFVCAHAAYLINPASGEPTVRRRSIEALKMEVRRADVLGCAGLVFHPGSPKEDSIDEGIRRLVDALAEVLEETAACRARVVLENTAGQGRTLGGDVRQFGVVFSRLNHHPRLAVCVDSCHAFAAGYDLRTDDGVQRLVDHLCGTVGLDRILVLHLNDSLYECGRRVDRHAHIGQGAIGLDGFRRLLGHPAFQGAPGIIETPKGGPDLSMDRKNLEVLRRLEMEGRSSSSAVACRL